MSRYKTIKVISILILMSICCVYLLIHCNQLIPEEFEVKDDIPIGPLADQACEYLSRDTTGGNYSFLQSMRMEDVADSVSMVNLTHNQIIHQSFNQLSGALDGITAQDLLIIDYEQSNGDTTYLAYHHTLAQSSMTFFITWEMTQDNKDAYIDIDIIPDDTILVKKVSNILAGTISGCIDTLIYLSSEGEETGREVVARIRSQFQFNLENSNYILRVINSAPHNVGPFRLVVLPSM
jgi:hypothetical protein